MKKESRCFDIECRAIESENKGYEVEGYATTFDDPYLLGENDDIRVYEKVDSKAFDSAQMDDVIFQYDHEGRVYARISNGTLKLEKDINGLKVWADLGGTEEGRKLYEEIKGGYTSKMSFCFIVTGEEEKRTKSDDGKTEYLRTITKISRVFDVSAVSLPANDKTSINARGFSESVFEKIGTKKRSEENQEDEKTEETQETQEEENEDKERELKERERLALEISFEL